ncbi:MAG: hypothetical protein ABI481_02465 [Pyrinomonadaceae bacterium]
MKQRFIFGSFLILALCAAFHSNVAAQDGSMTNEEVITLTKAGLSPSIIIGKIRSAKSSFDLSTDSLIKLKQAGVPDDIVAAMLEAKSGRSTPLAAGPSMPGDPNDPMTKHNYGIYLFEEIGGQQKMTPLAPNVSAQNRTGGMFTSGLTYGIGKVKIKSNLPGRNATLQIRGTQPVFYFYLDITTGGLNTASGIPSTPNEFAMIRFNQRSDNREVTIGKANAFGAKGGLSDEYVVQFTAQDLGNGVFKITPSVALTKGEYAFYLINSGNSNASSAVGAKFFDFGVEMTP